MSSRPKPSTWDKASGPRSWEIILKLSKSRKIDHWEFYCYSLGGVVFLLLQSPDCLVFFVVCCRASNLETKSYLWFDGSFLKQTKIPELHGCSYLLMASCGQFRFSWQLQSSLELIANGVWKKKKIVSGICKFWGIVWGHFLFNLHRNFVNEILFSAVFLHDSLSTHYSLGFFWDLQITIWSHGHVWYTNLFLFPEFSWAHRWLTAFALSWYMVLSQSRWAATSMV